MILLFVSFYNVLSAQDRNFSNFDTLLVKIAKAKEELRSHIINKDLEAIRYSIKTPFSYTTLANDSDSLFVISKKYFITKKEHVIFQFLLGEHKHLISDVIKGNSYFDVKSGALIHETLGVNVRKGNFTLDILTLLKKVDVDSLIVAGDINLIPEDVEFLKLYWESILICIETKKQFPPELKVMGDIYKKKYPESVLSERLVENKKMGLYSFNIEANLEKTFTSDKWATILEGGQFRIGITKKFVEYGIGYSFSDAILDSNKVLLNDFELKKNDIITNNDLRFYLKINLFKYKRVNLVGVIGSGYSRVYKNRTIIMTNLSFIEGLDLTINLSRTSKLNEGKLVYRNEEYIQS